MMVTSAFMGQNHSDCSVVEYDDLEEPFDEHDFDTMIHIK